MSDTRFVFLSPVREQSSSYLILDEKEEILSRGILVPGGEAASFSVRTLLIVPGTDVLVRWIKLPVCTPAQAASAAGLLLKDEIAVPRESVHLALGPSESDGFLPVCVVDRAVMRSFLDRAAALGIVPDAIVPDHMILRGSEDDCIRAAVCGAMVVARGKRIAFSVEPELAWLLVGKLPVQAVEGDIEYLMATSAPRPGINLMQNEFERNRASRTTFKDFKRAMALAAVLLLSPLVLWTAEFAAGHLAARALEARAQTSARALPGSGEASDPVLYARGRFAELQASDRFLATTAALFDAVVQMNAAEIESFSYLREGVIRATLIHADAAEWENLARGLQQLGIVLRQEPAKDGRGQPAVTITLRPRP